MTETPTEAVSTDLPTDFPAVRPGGCPFDPAAGYTALRGHDGIAKVSTPAGVDAWLFSRYDDVREVLGTRRLSSRSAPSAHIYPATDLEREVESGSILQQDGDRHRYLRRLLAGEFTSSGSRTSGRASRS